MHGDFIAPLGIGFLITITIGFIIYEYTKHNEKREWENGVGCGMEIASALFIFLCLVIIWIMEHVRLV